jgi:hypothetical protein
LSEPVATPRRLRLALVIAGVVLLVVVVLLFLNRKTLAREALTGWLRSKGVPAQAQVTAFGPSRFRATLRVGDARNPDFSAADVDVRYRLKGLGLEVQSVTLTKPVLRASLKGGTLHAGALDPLIEEFRRRPPRPDAAKPAIAVDDGVLLLATDYGPVRIAADMAVADGKLMRLTGTSAATRLRGQGLDVALAPASFDVITRGGRLAASLTAPKVSGRFGETVVDNAALTVSGGAPYPDLVKRRGDGALIAKASMSGRGLSFGEQRLSDFNLDLAFVGQTAGWVRSLTTTGQLSGELRARSVNASGAAGGDLRAAITMANLRWTRSGGDQVSGTLKLTGTANQVRAGALDLSQITAAVTGPVALGRGRTDLDLTGSAVGRGAWTGLGRPTAEDSAQLVALKRGLSAFRFAAPGVGLKLHDGAATFALPGELQVLPDTGGAITAQGDPAGAMRLAMAGGGLPKVSAQISNLKFTPGGFSANGALKGELSIGPVVDGQIDAAGRLTFAGGRTTFIASRCADLSADRLEFGANDIEALSGRLCPAGRPLLTLANGDWAVTGRAESVTARAPFLQAAVEGAAGRIDFGARRGRLSATALIDKAQVRDLAPDRRFNTMAMIGRAELLRGDLWSADLLFKTPSGVSVATATLTHTMTTGQGGVAIDTGPLALADGGLQPDQLSPLAAAVGSPVVGGVRFKGRFDWTPDGATSGGTLAIPSLDFTSPAGRVSGLAGDVAFTSLAPLTAAPGQELRIARLDAIVPVTNLSTTFGVRDETLHVAGGEAQVGGGRVFIESLDVPLTAGAPLKGILRIEGVQLHDLVEASPFGERIDFDAKVSGRLPFEVRDGKVRIASGNLKADQPGRISIQRALFEGGRTTSNAVVQTEGLAAPLSEALSGPLSDVQQSQANDTFIDMAFQGLENLAFQELDATINSRDDGRLAVLFHIKGRHDPPTRQRIKLTVVELLQRTFLQKRLPLPSGTRVNLTLDTSLNLDELLADYAEYNRLRSSGPVQP